jgi:nicotinamidase-related amidase
MATVAADLDTYPSIKILHDPGDNEHPESVVFGWEGQWEYLPESRLFDLSRQSTRTLTLPNHEANATYHGIKIDPDRSALVIVDMQNYFINPEYCHHPPGIATIGPLLATIERCRREGIQIIWLNWVTNESEMRKVPPAVLRCFNRARVAESSHGWNVNLGSEMPNSKGRVLFEGTHNADLYDPLKAVVAPDDIFCRKSRMSGMWSPDEDLYRYLVASGKKTVLFGGINTDQCVLSTITDAHSWGWDCVLLKDCSGTLTSPAAQSVAEYNIATCIGFVSDSKALVEAKAEGTCGNLLRHDSGLEFIDSAMGSEVDFGSDDEMAIS